MVAILGIILTIFVVGVFWLLGSNAHHLLDFLKDLAPADWEGAFNKLVRLKILQVGKYGKKERTKEKVNEHFEDRSTPLCFKIAERLVHSGRSKGNLDNNIVQVFSLYKELLHGNKKAVTIIAAELKRDVNQSISAAIIYSFTRELFYKNEFIVNRKDDVLLSYKETTNLVKSYTVMNLLVEDVLKSRSFVSKIIERRGGFTLTQVYNAIEFVIMLKLGAVEKALLEELARGGNLRLNRLNRLTETKIKNGILGSIRRDRSAYIAPATLIQDIVNSLKKITKFRNEFLNDKQKRQNKTFNDQHHKRKEHNKFKGKQEERKRQKTKKNYTPLDDAYGLLGCEKTMSFRRIKKRYQNLAMKKHPDRIDSKDDFALKNAHEEFIEIKNAFELIKKKKAS